jgi:hypothetical protein
MWQPPERWSTLARMPLWKKVAIIIVILLDVAAIYAFKLNSGSCSGARGC